MELQISLKPSLNHKFVKKNLIFCILISSIMLIVTFKVGNFDAIEIW